MAADGDGQAEKARKVREGGSLRGGARGRSRSRGQLGGGGAKGIQHEGRFGRAWDRAREEEKASVEEFGVEEELRGSSVGDLARRKKKGLGRIWLKLICRRVRLREALASGV